MRFAEYYDRLCSIIEIPEFDLRRYNRLFNYLYSTQFRWSIKNDANRAADGITLRNNIIRNSIEADALGPCRVLEMLIALAIRCENDIMQEESLGDRTGIWFWTMLDNLGLVEMDDPHYDQEVVQFIVSRFMDRKFDRRGYGSIFFANNRREDFRSTEFWYHMCWFLAEQYDCVI